LGEKTRQAHFFELIDQKIAAFFISFPHHFYGIITFP